MKLGYVIAIIGVCIGISSFMNGSPNPISFYAGNTDERKRMLAKCSARTASGKNCDNARLAEIMVRDTQ